MYAVIGRVKIKAGHEDETRAMIVSHGVAMIEGMPGASSAYWSRGHQRRRTDTALVLALRHRGKRTKRGGDIPNAPGHARGTCDIRQCRGVRGHRSGLSARQICGSVSEGISRWRRCKGLRARSWISAARSCVCIARKCVNSSRSWCSTSSRSICAKRRSRLGAYAFVISPAPHSDAMPRAAGT